MARYLLSFKYAIHHQGGKASRHEVGLDVSVIHIPTDPACKTLPRPAISQKSLEKIVQYTCLSLFKVSVFPGQLLLSQFHGLSQPEMPE
jgi:hypothetical protein